MIPMFEFFVFPDQNVSLFRQLRNEDEVHIPADEGGPIFSIRAVDIDKLLDIQRDRSLVDRFVLVEISGNGNTVYPDEMGSAFGYRILETTIGDGPGKAFIEGSRHARFKSTFMRNVMSFDDFCKTFEVCTN